MAFVLTFVCKNIGAIAVVQAASKTMKNQNQTTNPRFNCVCVCEPEKIDPFVMPLNEPR